MTQRVDIMAAAARSKEAYGPLLGDARQSPVDYRSDRIASFVLKLLTLIGAIYFTIVSATTMPPQLAFISITMIVIGTCVLVSGSEKIVQIFPRFVFRSPQRYRTYSDAHLRQLHRDSTTLVERPKSVVSSFLTRSYAGSRRDLERTSRLSVSTPPKLEVRSSPKRSTAVDSTKGNVKVGQGHDEVTASGHVIPGSRKRKK